MSKDIGKMLDTSFTKLFHYLKTLEETTKVLERRLSILEDLIHTAEAVDECEECGTNHAEMVAAMQGRTIRVRWNNSKEGVDKTTKGEWFVVVDNHGGAFRVQEVTGPAAQEKVGVPFWATLNECDRIEVMP